MRFLGCGHTALGALALLATFGCVASPLTGVDVVAVSVVYARPEAPRVLAVVAHPDDEIAFAGLLYKTATHLGGACDLVTITNGEGGFKYSTLAESLYGLPLTDPQVGRTELPEIRRRELAEGCRFLGIRDIYMLRQKDHRYTLDPTEVLDVETGVWDVPYVRRMLREVLERGHYDFVVTHTPVVDTHGHHKAATVLALDAVAELPEGDRPVAFGVRGGGADGAPDPPYAGLDGYPRTAQRGGAFTFDRAQPFGYRDRLNYKIVANWAIAAHKSQGTMQLLMSRGDREHYYLYRDNPADAESRARAWFDRLAEPQFETRDYDASSDARLETATGG